MKKKTILALTGVCVALGASAIALAGCSANEDALYGEWVTTVAATCEQEGVQTRALLSDPSVTQTRSLPATGHEWGEWEELTAPTCLVAGVQTRTCKTCENADYQPIAALGHEWGEWETTSAPTCTVAGYETRVCLHDENHTDLRATPALGHDWSEWVVTQAPACTEEGVETRYCRNCNDHTQTRAIPALGHDWGEWVVKQAPDEEYDGEEMHVCRNDKTHIETRMIPAVNTEQYVFTLNEEGTAYSIGVRAEYKSSSLTAVTVPATHNGLPVTEIAAHGFAYCSELKRVDFQGNHLTTIGMSAFTNCGNLESISLPDTLTEIGSSAFLGAAIKILEIPRNVVTVADAFVACRELKEVVIRSEVLETIGKDAFFGCNQLTSMHLPASVKQLSYSSFGAITLKGLTIAEENPYYYVQDGCLIEKGSNKLIACAEGDKIPEQVTGIGINAFRVNESTEIYIGANVTSVDARAFMNVRSQSSDRTIYLLGFASQQEADAAWGTAWREGLLAPVVYAKETE